MRAEYKYRSSPNISPLDCISAHFLTQHRCRCSCHGNRWPGSYHLSKQKQATSYLVIVKLRMMCQTWRNSVPCDSEYAKACRSLPGPYFRTDSCSFPSVCTVTRSLESVSRTNHLQNQQQTLPHPGFQSGHLNNDWSLSFVFFCYSWSCKLSHIVTQNWLLMRRGLPASLGSYGNHSSWWMKSCWLSSILI